ncbi:MAG: DUF2924 domain-containing protein [Candidatus Eisenbacteria bacterium]
MKPHIARQVAELQDMTLAELREKYVEVFGEPTTSRHKVYLQKRITWRLQANDEGGLSERALRRAAELANEADLRLLAPAARTVTGTLAIPQDRRLPMPGTVLTREYRGTMISVTVLDRGFEHDGTVYRSLTAIAKVVTGTHWNGFHFFGLRPNGGDR